MFKRIDHVELVTDEPERTVAFYTDVLEFKVKRRDQVGSPNGAMTLDLVYLELGGTTIEVITYHGAKPGPAASGMHLGWNLVALEVEDMGQGGRLPQDEGGWRDLGADGPRHLCPGGNPRSQRLQHRAAPVEVTQGSPRDSPQTPIVL